MPHRAKGLCRKCWWRQYRGTGNKAQYTPEMIEELDFALQSWDDLEKKYKRDRWKLAAYMGRSGRQDLRDRVHLYTYGTANTSEIVWIRRRARA